MAQTLIDVIKDTLHANLELNTLNVNQETPLTAFKLVVANEQMTVDNLNLLVQALEYATVPVIHTQMFFDNVINTINDKEHVSINIECDKDVGVTTWTLTSAHTDVANSQILGARQFRTARVAVNGVYCAIEYMCNTDIVEGTLKVTIKHDDMRKFVQEHPDLKVNNLYDLQATLVLQ